MTHSNDNLLEQINIEMTTTQFIRVSDLTPDKDYKIMYMEKTTTKYGQALRLTIEHNNRAVRVYANKKYLSFFTEERMQKVNSKEDEYCIRLNGYSTTFNQKILYTIKPLDQSRVVENPKRKNTEGEGAQKK